VAHYDAVMPERRIRRALISVYDKTGIVDFAKALVNEFGIEIISTGGTAALLKENGIPVTLVEQVTGFPEMLDGRVKTLHPRIHAAILADRDNPEHMRQLKEQGIEPIDMVVVDLYPFERTIENDECTVEQAIEMIDIGGPCMLRAAAKNHKHVLVIEPNDYADFLEDYAHFADEEWDSYKRDGAFQVFRKTGSYDQAVQRWLREQIDGTTSDPDASEKRLDLEALGLLKYGENPHQSAEIMEFRGISRNEANLIRGTHENQLLTDEDLRSEFSFNNYMDAHAALELCKELTRNLCSELEEMPSARRSDVNKSTFEMNAEDWVNAIAGGFEQAFAGPKRKACVFVKHTNPCGIGVNDDAIEAYRNAYFADPNAAMGGVLACNFFIDQRFAEVLMNTYDQWGKAAGVGGFFVEVLVAYGMDERAEEYLKTKPWGKRLRFLSALGMHELPDSDELEHKSITAGMLAQTRDVVGLNEDQWKVVTNRRPSESEMSDLRLAWLVAKHTKSNAISICKDGMLIGNGAGQMSRVMSCRIATWLAKENRHEDKLPGSAAASDAFFPFPDGPTILMDAGVTAIIQPGGSKNDDKVIAACDAGDVAMIFTGTRHFRH
jgi:phosphoribosylaminoimidazolecarboxamide formyltransferase/IMP cyclohydrolase